MASKTVHTVLWSAVERFSAQGIQFLLTLIIARIVQPSDYGLIAMVGIFLALAQTFIDSGFSNALIQKQERTETDYSTVFYFNIVVGIIIYIFLFLGAPLIAKFYNEPELIKITRVIGLILIISSFSVVQRTRLIIDLDFKGQAVASILSVTISGLVCIYLAFLNWGVWALITQILLNNLLSTILLCILAKWYPARTFSIASFKKLFSYGSKLLLSGLLHTIYVNLYSIVIGKRFSATDLGFYNRAYTIAYFPSNNISNIIIKAIFPIQCRIQHDNDELKRTFLQHINMSTFLVFPLMIGLCVLAKPFILSILTDKWLGAVPLLQILCIAYMWDTVMAINMNILKVKGRTDYVFKSEVIKKIVAVIILFVTMPWGIKTMCIGLIFYSFFDIIIISFYTKKVIGCTLWKQFKVVIPPLLLSLSMGLIIYLTISVFSNSLIQLFVGVIVGVISYFSLSFFFNMKELTVVHNILLSLKK